MSKVQMIDLSKVWRAKFHYDSFQVTPIGQVFAFDSLKLREQAQDEEVDSHHVLLRMAVQGLWECWPKRPVLVGYMLESEDAAVCRLFLMSKRRSKWDAFYNVASKYPSYLRTGQDFVMRTQTTLLVYWEPPCTMVALWPEGVIPENDAGLEDHGCFYQGDRWYRFLNREFDVIPNELDEG